MDGFSVETLFGQAVRAVIVKTGRIWLKRYGSAVVVARVAVVSQLAVAVGPGNEHRHVLLTVVHTPASRNALPVLSSKTCYITPILA